MVLFDVKSILAECKIVKKISVLKGDTFRSFNYELIFKTELVVDEENQISIIVCIPEKWHQNLIDIYVENFNEISFLPHIDNKGKICLFETEGVLIDRNLPGILLQSLFRAQSILKDGILKNSNYIGVSYLKVGLHILLFR